MYRMFWVAMVVACSGGSSARVCVPSGDYEWPTDCDDLNCHGAICDITCPAPASCGTLDCTNSPQCRIDCQPGTTCMEVDCTGATDCFVDCEDNATCDVTCTGATGCVENCRADSQCILRCDPTAGTACQFNMCPSPVDCGGGVLVCNRPCP